VVGELAVRVVAVRGGWSVQCDEVDHALMFLSGAKAEAKAHDLARRLAVHGRTTHVTIHDRNHVPLVTAFYFAEEAEDLSPAPAGSVTKIVRKTSAIGLQADAPGAVKAADA